MIRPPLWLLAPLTVLAQILPPSSRQQRLATRTLPVGGDRARDVQGGGRQGEGLAALNLSQDVVVYVLGLHAIVAHRRRRRHRPSDDRKKTKKNSGSFCTRTFLAVPSGHGENGAKSL